jgi:hypothetical protein
MNNSEQLLAEYSAQLGLSSTASVKDLIDSHKRIRQKYIELQTNFKENVATEVEYKLKQLQHLNYEDYRKLIVQEFIEWMNQS